MKVFLLQNDNLQLLCNFENQNITKSQNIETIDCKLSNDIYCTTVVCQN